MVPSGAVGKEFTREMTRFFYGFARSAAIERVTLNAIKTAPALLLQKPHPNAKMKECVTCLQCRLGEWRAGNIDELLREGRAIQHNLAYRPATGDSKNGQKFASFVHQGKIRAALRQLDNEDSSKGVLSLDERIVGADGKNVRQILRDKHPTAKKPQPSALLNPTSSSEQNMRWHPVVFDS